MASEGSYLVYLTIRSTSLIIYLTIRSVPNGRHPSVPLPSALARRADELYPPHRQWASGARRRCEVLLVPAVVGRAQRGARRRSRAPTDLPRENRRLPG